MPEHPKKTCDMYEVIRRVVDDGAYLDLKSRWARPIVTCLARLGGRPAEIVANNPKGGGVLDTDSADKAAHFIQICDAFNLPLVFLMDVPGSWGRQGSRTLRARPHRFPCTKVS